MIRGRRGAAIGPRNGPIADYRSIWTIDEVYLYYASDYSWPTDGNFMAVYPVGDVYPASGSAVLLSGYVSGPAFSEYTISWLRSRDGGITWVTLPGESSLDLSLSPSQYTDGDIYRMQAVFGQRESRSEYAVIVTEEVVIVFTEQPADVYPGNPETFSFFAYGVGERTGTQYNDIQSIVWQYRDGSGSWIAIPGEVDNFIDVDPSLFLNGRQFRARVEINGFFLESEPATLYR